MGQELTGRSMGRFVVIVDRRGGMDLGAALRGAAGALVRGGSLEMRHEIVRPPFAALVLAHDGGDPFATADDSISFAPGFGPVLGPEAGLPATLESAWTPDRTLGRRCRFEWIPSRRELRLTTEPNGHVSAYIYERDGRLVVSSEVKGIWGARPGPLSPNVDGVLDFFAVLHYLGDHTPFREIRSAEPGAVYSFRDDATEWDTYYAPRFSESHRGRSGRLAAEMNRALLDVLADYRPLVPRVTVSLSGGMDSRYVLAAALRTWNDVDSITFGQKHAAEWSAAREITKRAGIPYREHVHDEDFFPRWAGYGVWRGDGQLNCIYIQGIDAIIGQSARWPYLLNGVGGDIVLGGSSLRPAAVFRTGGAAATADHILRFRHVTDTPPERMFKPEFLRERTTSPRETLLGILDRYPYERIGNRVLCYLLRHFSVRATVVGLTLEQPFVEHIGPMVDAWFIERTKDVPLELRFLGRTYRKAVGLLAPEFASVISERVGLAPRWPWFVLAFSKVGIHYGLLPRPKPLIDHASDFRTTLSGWLRGVLLSKDALENGYFQPDYLSGTIERHERGEADLSKEIGLALTVELWRRIFIEGRADIADPPIEAGSGAGAKK